MASRKVNEASELPIDVTIMGPLRPFSSDQVPRKQAVNMAGTVKAMFTKRMYREALFCTISSVLQKNEILVICLITQFLHVKLLEKFILWLTTCI